MSNEIGKQDVSPWEIGKVTPAVDPNLEAAKNFWQPTSITEEPSSAAQLKEAKDLLENQPMAKGFVPDIRMQGGGEDDRDPNKERMDHERRMQEMYGEGRGGYIREFTDNVRNLKKLKDDLDKSQTDVEFYDETTKALFDRERDLRGENGDVTFLGSKSVSEAQARLQKQSIALQELISTGILNIDPRDKPDDRQNKKRLDRDIRKELKEAEKTVRLPELLNNEIERTREKLAEAYVNIMHSGIDEMNALNGYLEHLRNPYPYDSRYAMQFFEQGIGDVTDKLRNKSRYDEEGVALLKMLKRDLIWGISASKVNEAMGPAFELYFDGEMMLSRLRSPHTQLLARDFVRAFSHDVKGLDLTSDQKKLVRLTLDKVDFAKLGIADWNMGKGSDATEGDFVFEMELDADETKKQGKDVFKEKRYYQKKVSLVEWEGLNARLLDTERYKDLKEKGLREVAIDYQDAYGYWLYALVAAGQKNLDLGWNEAANQATQEMGEHYAEIDEVTFLFLSKAFDVNADQGKGEDLFYIAPNGGAPLRARSNLLNPFYMDRNDELANMAFQGRMHEIVVRKDYFDKKLNDLRSNKGTMNPDTFQNEITKLADEVIKEGERRIGKWESLDEQNPYDRLADTIIRNLNNFEKGTLGSGDLGWGWKYEKELSMGKGSDATEGDFVFEIKLDEDETEKQGKDVFRQVKYYQKNLPAKEWGNLNDKLKKFDELKAKGIVQSEKKLFVEGVVLREELIDFVVKRKSEMGSIYDNHDVTTVMFIARHIVDYDNMAETRTTIFPPTIGFYREQWASEPPYWRPRLETFAGHDRQLLRSLGIEGETGILGKANVLEKRIARMVYKKGESGLQPQYFDRFDPDAAKFIRENVWAFVTPFLERPGDPKSGYIVLPMFIPTQIKDMSFQRMTTLEKPSDKVIKQKGKSIFHQRLKGEKISSLKWENMDKYKFSWAEVTTDQMERWLGPLVSPHDFNRTTADEVKKHLMSPSGKSSKEGGKRFRLGGRAGLVKEGVLRATVAAQNKIIASVSLSGVMGSDSMEPGLTESLESVWAKEWVAEWMNVELDMPPEVRGCTNYGGTSAQVMAIMHMQLEKYVRSAIKHGIGQKGRVLTNLIGTKDNVGPIKSLYGSN